VIGAITAGLYGTGVPPVTNSYESIATVTVGGGGAATASFTSIPSTYKHLQIRAFLKSTYSAGSGTHDLWLRFNSDTGSNYAYHVLYGDGASAVALAGASQTKIVMPNSIPRQPDTSVFGGYVIDILDYANTSKNKTVRTLTGANNNSTATAYRIALDSGLWTSTSAITQIDFLPESDSFAQYSSFALYGIKG
jgi:hypothetical protein